MHFLGVGIYCIEALCLILSTILTKEDYCSQGILLVLFIKNKKYFMYRDALLACMSVHYAHVWCLRKLEEGVGSSGKGYEPPSGCWDSNLGEDPVLLTTEPTL